MPELVIEHPTSNPNSGNIPNGNYLPHKDLFGYSSPRSPLSTHSPESDSMDLGVDSPGALDTSIEQLYHNVCEMQSSDQSPSRFSYLSYGHESRIDSELRFLAGGDFMKPAGDVTKEPGVETDEKEPNEASNDTNSVVVKPNESSGPKARTISPKEEIASGLIEVSAIYESMKELDQALNLLKKALKVYGKAPGQSSTVAGIEAQIGVLYYMMGRYSESYNSLKAAVAKLRVIGEKKSALFGVALNQMGLACVQINSINEAADLFEEARGILETEYGPHHPDTLGVYSNLAGTYDAMGRWNDAIEILEYVVGMREEKLGTANPDVEDEKRRLAELLEDVGRNRNKKSLSLEYLLDA
ncbi:putative tetratricopeptide-like helical domain superfamily [Helianthus annuus]|nr:putative tetratricopeptide-like helical domain superfamily [Helianthus annuus]